MNTLYVLVLEDSLGVIWSNHNLTTRNAICNSDMFKKVASNIFGVDFETPKCIILCGHTAQVFVNIPTTEVPTYQFLGRRLD